METKGQFLSRITLSTTLGKLEFTLELTLVPISWTYIILGYDRLLPRVEETLSFTQGRMR